MALDVALQLEAVGDQPGRVSGGVCYDFKKAFDLIPHELLFAAMERRGCHKRILLPMQALYRDLWRVFKLRGACSSWWTAANGLIQGCPLSMIGLNSLVGVVLEVNVVACPSIVGRAYADDISAASVADSPQQLTHQISRFHQIVRALESTGFGEISLTKSHTFGDDSIRGKLDAHYGHMHAFKLVGGSFVTQGAAPAASGVEQARMQTWAATVATMRYAPHPWRQKARMLLATQSQATYGQGTHSFQADLAALKKIRSNIMRCLWSTNFYSMNPNITFALLAPPHLDPFFGPVYQGLRTILRCMRQDSFRCQLRKRFHEVAHAAVEGPSLRLKLLVEQGIFGESVMALFHDDIVPEQWAHDLRMRWRHELVSRAARDRPQHFADLIVGCDYTATMALYKQWDRQVQEQFDEPTVMAMGGLRRLLAGGLLTDESNARHRKQKEMPKCPCGASPTVLHLSWCCPLHDDLRQPLFQLLGHNGDVLPACTRYATIVPAGYAIPLQHIQAIQRTLVQIWQRYIRSYKQSISNAVQVAMQSNPAVGSSDQYEENGHVIGPRPEQPGVWCCKCGLYVQRLKHVRLKITSKQCRQAALPKERWLRQEGYVRAESRLDQLERDLQHYNKGGHSLHWNRKVGKQPGSPEEGILTCTTCRRTWSWRYRCNNLPKTVCKGPPAGTAQTVAVPSTANLQVAIPSVKPSRRLRSKTSPLQFHVSTPAGSGQASSAHVSQVDQPQHEHERAQNVALEWRRGVG